MEACPALIGQGTPSLPTVDLLQPGLLGEGVAVVALDVPNWPALSPRLSGPG